MKQYLPVAALIQHTLAAGKGRRGGFPFISALPQAGFVYVGDGAVKSVWQHPDWPMWVVKAFVSPDAWRTDDSSIGLIPPELCPYFLWNVYACKRFVIQPYANGLGGDRALAHGFFVSLFAGEHYSKYELWKNNVAFHNHNPVVLDFIYHDCPKKFRRLEKRLSLSPVTL